MTSTPTKAMLAAALGRPYHISYGGSVVFQHADDAAAAFRKALGREIAWATAPTDDGPLRLVVPGWYGMTSVKWLTSLTVTDAPYDGFQNAVAYRYKSDAEDVGEPVTTIAPRALVVPPGFPDFGSRRRIVAWREVARLLHAMLIGMTMESSFSYG